MKFKTMYGKNKMKVPEINVIECDIKIIDHIMFEYEMIQRAREAEIILNQMLYNGKFTYLFWTDKHKSFLFTFQKPLANHRTFF